jgi:hypothetical protein
MEQFWQSALSLGKLPIAFFGIGVAVRLVNGHGHLRENFDSQWSVAILVMTEGSVFMIAGSFGLDHLLALAVLLILAAWMAKKQFGAFFKSITAGGALTNNLFAERLFAAKPSPLHKNCPNCAKQTPLSALFCDACDFNFLSGMVGSKLKSLPAPKL